MTSFRLEAVLFKLSFLTKHLCQIQFYCSFLVFILGQLSNNNLGYYRDDDKGLAIMSRHRYPVEVCRIFERTSTEKLQAALTRSMEPAGTESVDGSEQVNNASDVCQGMESDRKVANCRESNKKVNDGARSKHPTLKVVLGEALGYGPALLEHIILDAGLIPNTKGAKNFKLEDDTLQLLVGAVSKFEDWLEDIISGDKITEGSLLLQ